MMPGAGLLLLIYLTDGAPPSLPASLAKARNGRLLTLAWAPVAARSWEGGKAIPKAILFALTGICLFCGILFTFNASATLSLPSPVPPLRRRRRS